MLNVQKKKKKKKNKKKLAIIQKLKISNSLYNFGRDHPQEYAWSLGSKSVVHFQIRCCLKFFSSEDVVNENEKKKKKMAKIQNLKFRQSLYNFDRDPL